MSSSGAGRSGFDILFVYLASASGLGRGIVSACAYISGRQLFEIEDSGDGMSMFILNL